MVKVKQQIGRAVCPHAAGFAVRLGCVVVVLAISTASTTGLGGESGRVGTRVPTGFVGVAGRSGIAPYRRTQFSIFNFQFSIRDVPRRITRRGMKSSSRGAAR